jgi:hypothetical protein
MRDRQTVVVAHRAILFLCFLFALLFFTRFITIIVVVIIITLFLLLRDHQRSLTDSHFFSNVPPLASMISAPQLVCLRYSYQRHYRCRLQYLSLQPATNRSTQQKHGASI